MKTQITLSVEEAEQRLASKILDDLPYSNNEVSVKIDVSEPQFDNLPLNRVSKIALIKMVRILATEALNNRIKVSIREPGTPGAGEKYLGLADAKEYVENYIKIHSPQV
jgi:hypothetical protein